MKLYLLFKLLASASVIVVVSEVAKRSDKLGAFISSLPISTLIVLTWMYLESQSSEKLGNHTYYSFWYVLGSLPLFLYFSYFMKAGYGFLLALPISILLGSATFFLTGLLLKQFGINYW